MKKNAKVLKYEKELKGKTIEELSKMVVETIIDTKSGSPRDWKFKISVDRRLEAALNVIEVKSLKNDKELKQ